MKMNAYAIYDTAGLTFMRPFFTSSDAMALRAFKDVVSDATHVICKHPEDYSLHRLGTWCDQTGDFNNEITEQIQTGLEMVASIQSIDRDWE